jgi:hypothetical protein
MCVAVRNYHSHSAGAERLYMMNKFDSSNLFSSILAMVRAAIRGKCLLKCLLIETATYVIYFISG